MADGDIAAPTLDTLEAVLSEAARRGVTKVVVAIDLRHGYDESDGYRRCSAVATHGVRGNMIATQRGHSLPEAILETLRTLGVLA